MGWGGSGVDVVGGGGGVEGVEGGAAAGVEPGEEA